MYMGNGKKKYYDAFNQIVHANDYFKVPMRRKMHKVIVSGVQA